LAAFSIVATVLDVSTGLGATEAAVLIFNSVFTFIWQMLGGVALGFLVGLMLASWATRITEHGELLILLIGAILLCVGAARILDISPLIASLAVGATMVNFSQRSRRLFSVISRTDPPLYAIFFVIAGADLDLNLLGKLGALGVVYIAARSLGKLGGGWLGARWLGMESGIQRNLGSALLSQAGLAIGLTLGIGSRYPEYGPTVAAVVLGAVIVFELVGPISTRFAVLRESACTV
jgi:Kef-type K+ transport system membrane component KefB